MRFTRPIPLELQDHLDELVPADQDPNAWADAELASDASDFEAKHGERHEDIRHILNYYVSFRAE